MTALAEESPVQCGEQPTSELMMEMVESSAIHRESGPLPLHFSATEIVALSNAIGPLLLGRANGLVFQQGPQPPLPILCHPNGLNSLEVLVCRP